MAKICLGCLNPLPEGDESCRICGFSAADKNPSVALAVKTVLQEHYTVGRMVHEGSDSLYYLGYDKVLKEPCFIQEYCPATLCSRGEDGALTPLGGCENPYADYQKQFNDTMRALARVKDLPGILPIYDIFEENGTTYAVSDYIAGETLDKKLADAGGRIPWPEARPLFMSLMTCVEQLAAAGIHHLAICPDNILVDESGKAQLRGFSIPAARQVGSDLSPRLATGYAAPEQYDMDGIIGEETDVYGIAATIFRVATGNEPPAGNSRAVDGDDLYMSADIAEELTQPMCIALFNALQVSPADRTATVKRLHAQLSMEPNVSALLDEDTPQKPAQKKNATLLIVFSIAAAVLLALGILALILFGDFGGNTDSEPPQSLPEFVTSTTATTKPVKYSIPELVGKNYYEVDDMKFDGKFNIKLDSMKHDDSKAGTILSQTPEKGTIVDAGETITVVVSLGKDNNITVPDLTGGEWKESQAKELLEAMGFKVEIAEIFISDYEYGIVEGTDPAAGTVKKRGDTITLRVSRVEKDVDPTTDPTDDPTDDTTVDDITDPTEDAGTDPTEDVTTDPTEDAGTDPTDDITEPTDDVSAEPTDDTSTVSGEV